MSRQQAVKAKFQDRLEELKALRDNIRVDLRLASMELRDEWRSLEGKLPDAAAVGQIKEVTAETIDRLSAELRGFRSRLRSGVAQASVEQIMTTAVASCSPSDTLARAITIMWDRDVGCLPVLGERAQIVGIITDRDAAVAAVTRGKRMDEIAVDTVMSKNVASCPPDARPEEALALMRTRQVRRLPVLTTEGNLVGVVTINDLARSFTKDDDRTARPSGVIEVIQSLTAITGPPARAGSVNN